MNESLNNDAFCKALAKLKEFADMPILNDRDRAGIIQAFEFTFEQCWKMFNELHNHMDSLLPVLDKQFK